MTPLKAIVLNEDATNRDAEDILELINVEGARVVTLAEEIRGGTALGVNPPRLPARRWATDWDSSEWEGEDK